jgi:PAS domain S-box-containing protein
VYEIAARFASQSSGSPIEPAPAPNNPLAPKPTQAPPRAIAAPSFAPLSQRRSTPPVVIVPPAVRETFEAYTQDQLKLQGLFNIPLDLLCLIDRDGTFAELSPSWTHALGWSTEELRDRSWSQWVHPHDLQSSYLHLNTLLNQRGSQNNTSFENRLRHRDGSYRWYKWTLTPGDLGKDALYGFARDITEQKANSFTLFERESEFYQLAENLRDVFWIYDPIADKQLYVSPSYERVWGRSCESLYANPESLKGAIHPEDQAYVHTQQSQAKDGRTDLQYRIVQPNGEIRWIHDRSFPLKDGLGRVYRFIGVAEDISDQRQAEQECDRLFQELSSQNQDLESQVALRTTELRQSEERFRAIFEQAAVGISLVSPEGKFTTVNQRFCDLLGYSEAELMGMTFQEITEPDHLAADLTQYEKLLAGEITSFDIEKRFIRKDGRYQWATLTVSGVYDASGKMSYDIGVLQDITDRKNAEADVLTALVKAQELNELKSRVISMISHEYRTPLTIVQTSLDLLEHYGETWEPGRLAVHFDRIKTAVGDLNALVNDVLFFNKAETDRLDFRPRAIDVEAAVRDVFDAMAASDHQAHPLELDYQGSASHLWIDAKLLRQILSNLLSNAQKYSPNGSPIACQVRTEADRLAMTITDQGIGIPEEDKPYLFESFHRATNAQTLPGTGLGLAIVKKCIEAHGGQIQITSQLDRGTTIAIELPNSPPLPLAFG